MLTDTEKQAYIRNTAYTVRNTYQPKTPVNVGSIIRQLGGDYIFQTGMDTLYDGSVMKRSSGGFMIRLPAYLETREAAESLVRYALGVELGHALLHMGYGIDLGLWKSLEEDRYFLMTETMREEARTFAEYLLMPEDEFSRVMKEYTERTENAVSMQKVADHFGVILAVAIKCGKNRGMLSTKL